MAVLAKFVEFQGKVREFVKSESAFFNAFLEDGLRFSWSMFLCLIWIRVLRYVFQNPGEAAKHLQNHPLFILQITRNETARFVFNIFKKLPRL